MKVEDYWNTYGAKNTKLKMILNQEWIWNLSKHLFWQGFDRWNQISERGFQSGQPLLHVTLFHSFDTFFIFCPGDMIMMKDY